MKILQKIVMVMGLVGVASMARGDVYLGEAKRQATNVKSAEEIVSSLPILKKIPTSFLIGDGFKFKFNGQSLRIDHMGTGSVAPAHKRNCLVSFSFSSPVAFFGSRVDVPLMFSETPEISKWRFNTLGDYVMNFSKDADTEHPVVGLSITARF